MDKQTKCHRSNSLRRTFLFLSNGCRLWKICKHDINMDALLYKFKINMWYTMYDLYITSFPLLSFNQVHNQLRCRFPSRGPIISPFLPLSLHHFSCPTLSIPFSSLPPPSPRQSAVQGQAAVTPFPKRPVQQRQRPCHWRT